MKWPVIALSVFCLTYRARVLAAAPSNDNFNGAIALSGTNVTATGTNVGASKEVGEPNHAANIGGRSVWWKWTAPGPGSVVMETTGSSFDTLLAAYTGNALMTLSLVVGNDDAGSQGTSKIGFNVTAGTTYWIAVDGYTGSSGDIRLAVGYRSSLLAQPPKNDQFADRINLRGSAATASSENFFATKQAGEPNHAGELGGASLWWAWTAPVSGKVVLDTHGSDFDTLLAVYTGTILTNLAVIANNDSINTNDLTSQVTFPATANTTYLIAVDGYNDDRGYIQLNVQMKDIVWFDAPKASTSGGFKLTLTGPLGSTNTIDYSQDLVHWTELTSLANRIGSVEASDLDGTSLNHRFYRARQAP